MPMLEYLCGCRSMHPQGGDVKRRCREARRLLKATEGEEPLDYRSPGWNAYAEHYTDEGNPVVRELVNNQWVERMEEAA